MSKSGILHTFRYRARNARPQTVDKKRRLVRDAFAFFIYASSSFLSAFLNCVPNITMVKITASVSATGSAV